jgi:hypothetical protein
MKRIDHDDLSKFFLSPRGVVAIAHVGSWGRDPRDMKTVLNWTDRGFLRFQADSSSRLKARRYSLGSVIQTAAIWTLAVGGTSLESARLIADRILDRAFEHAKNGTNLDDEDQYHVAIYRHYRTQDSKLWANKEPSWELQPASISIADLYNKNEPMGLSQERRIFPVDDFIDRMARYYREAREEDGTFTDLYTS